MLHGNPSIVGIMGDCSVLDWFINFPFPMRVRVSTLASKGILRSPPHAPCVFWVVISGPASTSFLVT